MQKAASVLRGRQPALPARRPARLARRAHVIKAVAAPMRPPTPVGRGAASRDEDGCPVFIDRDNNVIKVLCCDYGFRTGAARMYQDKYGEVPKNVLEISKENFAQELRALRRSVRYNEYTALAEAAAPTAGPLRKVGDAVGGALVRGLSALDTSLEKAGLLPELAPPEGAELSEDGSGSEECQQIRAKLQQLRLVDKEVWEREERRKAAQGDVNAPWYIRAPFWALCVLLDIAFGGRPIQRFWVLETVARIPYFAYISILHLYESLGLWRAGAELRKVHFAEEWNELHHLQIMESLGGDQLWIDRFLAEHAAILYYWMLIAFYMFSPRNAYAFSELVELHATDTYAQFVETNEALLKSLPPPMVAAAYYRNQDLYMFDEMQNSNGTQERRPECNNLYDVFCNIRDDEVEHVKTMHACQDDSIARNLQSWRNDD